MFSSIGPFTLPSKRNATSSSNRKSFLQAPRGLSVRAFKGPTLSSHPFTTTDKYDVSYRPTSHAEPWQAANWATAPRTLAARTSSANLNDMLAGYVDSSSSMPCVERLPSAQTRRLSAYQNDIYDRSVPPNPYPHNNPDPYVRYGTPYPSLHPLDGSTQSLMGSAESDDFESNAHIPSSPPLSVRHLIPPAVPHLREARSGAVIFGDPTQGYPPFSVSESFTCAPFIGLSSLPPSARSDSDDDTVVAPEEHDGGFKSGYTANGQDVYGTTFIPAGPPDPGSHPVHVTRSDYDDRQNNHLMPAAPPNLGDGAHGVVSFQQTSTWPGQPFPPPSRRHTDPGQTRPPPPTVPERSRRLSMSAPRCVRWNENLICPSPILSSQRRKGWFNRRGDQLWTNDGAYKPAAPGQEYPPDLDAYPEFGQGWMNEDGTRIDIGHHLIPKVPLRSALKKPRSPVRQQELAGGEYVGI